MKILPVLILIVLLNCDSHRSLSPEEMEQIGIGRLVMKTRQLIDGEVPDDTLEAVIRFGQDSRYYTLVRGWLNQEIQGAESIRNSTRQDTVSNHKMSRRIQRLQQVIRRIDLE